eukprot:TRINITY_DN15948_c0_g1_i1.p1 TRINITY_DN15948_c0_g1~~TRINITY_DN15948_c0_g1_i1.p1  ORF type:complete len:398 (-),score=19.39 TRINITY_DN15948_c0_g1_i1:113-1306(-)
MATRAKADQGVTVLNNVLKIGEVSVIFNRTLRIPDDGGSYPLPPGLGHFPVRRVSDHQHRVPESWKTHGGVFLPMYQREALWLKFSGPHWKPNAVKVAMGKVCALTGKQWSESLHNVPEQQDYIVVPKQPWIDGINSGNDTVRQFVAMPLGMGYTVEGQVTGEEKHGGLQLCVFEPKAGHFEAPVFPPARTFGFSPPSHPIVPEASESYAQTDSAAFGARPPSSAPTFFGGGTRLQATFGSSSSDGPTRAAARPSAASDLAVGRQKLSTPVAAAGVEMGLAAGGRMRQEIYADPHGLSVWDESSYSRVFVHLCNSEMWRQITGEAPPESPVTAQTYSRYGMPWFELYDEGQVGIDASDKLAAVKSVKEMDAAKGFGPLQDDSSISFSSKTVVKDGQW